MKTFASLHIGRQTKIKRNLYKLKNIKNWGIIDLYTQRKERFEELKKLKSYTHS